MKHTIEIETVASANGSPRMLLGRNLPIFEDCLEGLWKEVVDVMEFVSTGHEVCI